MEADPGPEEDINFGNFQAKVMSYAIIKFSVTLTNGFVVRWNDQMAHVKYKKMTDGTTGIYIAGAAIATPPNGSGIHLFPGDTLSITHTVSFGDIDPEEHKLAGGGHIGPLAAYSISYDKIVLGAKRPEVDKLPGLREKVKCPVSGAMGNLQTTIIYLNDTAKWTRGQIADWLETLDVDLRFKPKEEKEVEHV